MWNFMKVFCSLLLCLFIAGYIYPGDVLTLTLSNALDLALKNNLDVLQADKDVRVAEALVGQSYADLLIPTVTASGNFSYLDPKTASKGVVTEPYGSQNAVITNTFPDNYSGALGITKPLFQGFKYWNAAVTQRLNLVLAQNKLQDTIKNVQMTIMTNFYDLFLYRENVRINNEIDQNLKGKVDSAEISNKRGMISELDYLKAILPYKTNIPKLTKARHDEISAKVALCDSLNLTNYDGVEFIGSFLDITNYAGEETNEEYLFIETVSNDITLQTIVYNIDSAKLTKQTQEWSRLPSLTAGFNYDYDYKKNDFSSFDNTRYWQPSWTFNLQLSMPIDDLLPFSSSAKNIESQDENIKKLEFSRQSQVNTLRETVITSLHQIEELKETAQSQADNLEIARRTLEMTKLQLGRGNVTGLDLQDAQISYDQALLAYYQSLYDYISAVLKQRRTSGLSLFGKSFPKT